MDSSFIERFGIWGMAGVLGLMAVLGVYGFASLLGVEPNDSLIRLPPRPEEEVAFSDGPGDGPASDEIIRPEASPAARSGGTPFASPTPGESPRPSEAQPPQPQVLSLAREESRPAGGAGAPAAPPAVTATPATSPAGVATPAPGPNPPPPTPAPATPPPATPAPTDPPPPVCSPGAPQLEENGNQVRFSNGSVVAFQGGPPGVLILDVGGTPLALLVTEWTEVRGVLGAATVVSGQGHRANDGAIVAQALEVVCPESAR